MTRKPTATPRLAPRTSFVGRETELAEIRRRFEAGDRLVTLLGPPGVGKTRLAERLAASEGGAMACPLAEAQDEGDLARALARALDVPLGAQEDHLDRLGQALAARGTALVIVDAPERVAEAAGAALGALLDAAPAARFVCASRRRLGVEGESCVTVEGLPREDARALFAARARLAGRTRELEGDEGALLDALLDRLDHLPLAIELAAARAGALSLKQLALAVERRFEVLATGSAGIEPRHRSLRAAIDASWELLPQEERRTLARASVFEGAFSLRAAAAVLGTGEAGALAAIEALRDRSLARAEEGDEEVRFALYSAVRAYAAERLDESGERGAAEEAHARFYAAEGARLAAELLGARPVEARRALARDLDQLLAAVRRARAAQPAVAAEAALAAQALLVLRGPEETLRAVADAAVEMARAAGDPALASRALFARGRALGMRGLYAAARRDAEVAREAARRAGDEGAEARAIYAVSFTLRESGEDPARARELAEEGLALARQAGDVEAEAWCLGSVAAAAAECGDTGAAIARHEEALLLLRRLGHVRALAIAHGNLALALDAAGRADEARAQNLEALELAEQSGDETLRGKILWALARLEFAAGRAAEAEARRAALEDSARRTGDGEGVAMALLERARWALLAGDRDAGLRALTKAHAAALAVDSPRLLREVEEARALSRASGPALRAGAEGYWFERAGLGRVDLSRRRSLRLIFARLLEARPSGAALSAEALLEAGWPGESVHPEAGAQRVWTAVRALRKMGLSGVLVQRDGGYALDPGVPIEID